MNESNTEKTLYNQVETLVNQLKADAKDKMSEFGIFPAFSVSVPCNTPNVYLKEYSLEISMNDYDTERMLEAVSINPQGKKQTIPLAYGTKQHILDYLEDDENKSHILKAFLKFGDYPRD